MVLSSEKEMHIACEQWLCARKHIMRGAGAELLEEYCAASERLFAAFIRDFRSEDYAVVAHAFRTFRGCLAESGDGPRAYPAWSPEKSLRTKS
jgi:hypothetical protein